jgi:subtilisin family serine protease
LRSAPATVDAERLAEQVIPGRSVRAETLQADALGGIYLIHLDQSTSVENAIKIASSNPNVEYAEPDYYVHPAETMPNDPRFAEQWGLNNDGSTGKAGADIGVVRVWDSTTGSDDVVVAVIDTGLDLTHFDLAQNIWVNPGETPGNGVDDDGNGFVDDVNGWNFLANNNDPGPASDFHGTHVAGIVGAVGNNGLGVSGVAWRVKLMALKFIEGRTGEVSDAIKAINYAVRERRRGVNVRVINASWGDSEANSTPLRDAIAAAGNKGILFVCAADNGGSDSRGDDLDVAPDYPAVWSADLHTIVSVAALDSRDNLGAFSNYGSRTVTVGAPGVGVLSTVPGNGYGFLTGTSMATPHVAGVAALLWAREPSLTPEQVRDRIVRSAVPVLSLAAKCVSSGRANAFNAASNTIAPVPALAIGQVVTTKKWVDVDGLGFADATSVIEINGVQPARTRYDSAFVLANGTSTRLSMKLGKEGIISTFPLGVPVTVTVLNPTTGQRSPGFTFVRR